ncbi:MAG: phage portal protein [Bosea sp. (in: a-proteobacteria)]
MPSFLDRLRGVSVRENSPVLEEKRSRAGYLIAMQDLGRPRWTPRDYAALARESYMKNAVAFRCVRLIAEAAAQTPLVARIGTRETREHPVLSLLMRPNPRQSGISFLDTVYGYLLVAGNAYVERVDLDGAARELHALRPDRVRIVPGSDGWPAAFDYSVGDRSVRYGSDEMGRMSVLHLATFHPLDDHYGVSPVEAAAQALDIHNGASGWNKSLLDNAARPSGALVYDAAQGGTLTDAQFERLKAELEESFQGARNAGRPLLLEGGLDWKPLSLSPKDMDFIAAKAAAAREIALAFGVPPLLLGLPGDSTHANYAEANRAFWRQTAIPLVRRTMQAISQWLAPDEALVLEPDLDAIEALADERESLWRRVGAADFISQDEKREAVGYGRNDVSKASTPATFETKHREGQ